MILIIGFALIMAFIAIPYFRCIFLHPFHVIFYAIKDIWKYVHYARWREYRGYGTLTIFNGLFGKGKTLSSTIYGRKIYKRYNGKKVFDFNEKKWKTQFIKLVSNVDIKDCPYMKLNSLNDITKLTEHNDGVSVWVVCVDEMSTQVNSREYKTNFSTDLLNVLLTCRHYRMQMIGSAQRFAHVDALVRQVTANAIECRKLWRLLQWDIYDAWTVENTTDITKIKPKKRKCVFVTDKDFNAYDTVACVESFKKNVLEGKHLTDKEIMDFQTNAENELSLSMKRKYRKKLK